MTDPYRRPSLPPLPGDQPEYDPLRAFNNYRRDTNVQGYQPSSLEGYFQSRQSSPYARGTAGTTAPGYTPAAPPERFQFDLLAGLGQGVMGAAESGLGKAFLATPPDQRGGSQPLFTENGPKLATAPVNFQNFATYAREAQLAALTSILGHKYQQPEGEDPYARPVGYDSGRNVFENIGQGDLEGVLDNVIDGVGAVGSAIDAPIVAFNNWWRGWVASDRGREVRALALSGDASQGQFRLIRTITHITGLDSITDWQGIARHADDKGIDMQSAMTELFDLSPEVINKILDNPNISDEDLTQLVKDEPFSYDPASDLIANLVVTLAPMLGAVKVVTLGAKAVSGLRTARAISATYPGYSPGHIMATADRIGSWAAQPLWRRSLKLTGAVSGFSPTGIKIGAGIRAGEWLFKQIGVSLGNEAMVEAADRWLYEMPLSTSPGLMMLDAFAVHPGRGAKDLFLGKEGPTGVRSGGLKGAAVRIAGKGEVPVSKVYADRIGTIADADFDTLTPIIERLGWERGTIDAVFGDGGPLSVVDFKNGLMHLAMEKVRQQNEVRASRILPEGTAADRLVQFTAEYGDEAAKLLGDEIAGRSTVLTDELRVEFWERSQLIDAAELGGEGYIGPYDPATALVGFASWMRFSKLVAEAADDVLVAKLRTDVNSEFVRAYREAIEGSYAKPGSVLSQRDLNRLRTFVPASAAVLTRKGDRVPKVTKRQMLKLLDDLEREQGTRDYASSRPRNEAVPALTELEVASPAAIAKAFRLHQATVEALQRALVEGVDALGPVPPELARVLQAVHGLTSEHVRRSPKEAWTKAASWFEGQLSSAVARGELVAQLKAWRQAVETRAPRSRNADLDLDLEAIKRVEDSLTHPYADALLKDPSDRAFAEARDAQVTEFMDRLGKWVESKDRQLTVERVGELDVLAGDGFRPNDLAIIESARGAALRFTNLRLTPAELALLADPLAHPLEHAAILVRGLDAGLRVSQREQRVLRTMPDLEGAYGVLADDVLGPDPARAVDRAVVEDLTKRGARSAQEFTDLRTSGRALGGLIERTPGRVLTEDSRAFLERAAVLGATKVGAGPKGSRVENWRSVLIEPEGVRAVSNADAISRGREVLTHDLAVRQNVLDHYSTLLDRQQARMTDTLTVDDFTWTEVAADFKTRKAALAMARELHDAGIYTRQPAKVGNKWLLERGELKERAPSPPESVPPAPEAPGVVSEAVPTQTVGRAPESVRWTGREGSPPDIGEPVVVDGTKYRIRAFDSAGGIVLAEAGPQWRKAATSEPLPKNAPLTWDKTAGVWREAETAPLEAARQPQAAPGTTPEGAPITEPTTRPGPPGPGDPPFGSRAIEYLRSTEPSDARWKYLESHDYMLEKLQQGVAPDAPRLKLGYRTNQVPIERIAELPDMHLIEMGSDARRLAALADDAEPSFVPKVVKVKGRPASTSSRADGTVFEHAEQPAYWTYTIDSLNKADQGGPGKGRFESSAEAKAGMLEFQATRTAEYRQRIADAKHDSPFLEAELARRPDLPITKDGELIEHANTLLDAENGNVRARWEEARAAAESGQPVQPKPAMVEAISDTEARTAAAADAYAAVQEAEAAAFEAKREAYRPAVPFLGNNPLRYEGWSIARLKDEVSGMRQTVKGKKPGVDASSERLRLTEAEAALERATALEATGAIPPDPTVAMTRPDMRGQVDPALRRNVYESAPSEWLRQWREEAVAAKRREPVRMIDETLAARAPGEGGMFPPGDPVPTSSVIKALLEQQAAVAVAGDALPPPAKVKFTEKMAADTERWFVNKHGVAFIASADNRLALIDAPTKRAGSRATYDAAVNSAKPIDQYADWLAGQLPEGPIRAEIAEASRLAREAEIAVDLPDADAAAYGAAVNRLDAATAAGARALSEGPTPAPREVTFLDPGDNKTPIRARVILAEADQLLTSDEAGYPQNLQPRSRDLRIASDEQIKAMAKDLQPDKLVGMTEGGQGTPVVTADGVVLAGNGRTAAIRLASKAEYEKYRARIVEEAVAQGFDPEAVAAMDRPMLLRELVDVSPEAMERLAWQLNPTGMAIGDLAAAFAKEITATDLASLRSAGKGADLRDVIVSNRNTAVVKRIIAKLPPDWVAQYLDPVGNLNQAGVQLVEGSIFAKLLRADDRTLPLYGKARNLVLEAIEQGGEEMRRIFNGVFDAAPEMLKAQQAAEAGTLGREFLGITDRLVEALDDILRRRRDGKTMAGIVNDLSTVDAFPEYTLHPVTHHMARLLAESSGQGEIGAFLKGVAESTTANAGPGLFGDAVPVEAAGLLNQGVKAWNDLRATWNADHPGSPPKTLIDNFPSEQAPFDTALTGTRVLDDGSTAPPVVKSQPILPEELGGEINARLAGEAAAQIVEGPDQVMRDVPGEVRFTDPDNVRLMEALREDTPRVRADLEDVIATYDSFGELAAKRDFLGGIIEGVNDGTATPAEWLWLSTVTTIRRNARGKLNMKPVATGARAVEIKLLTTDALRTLAARNLNALAARALEPVGEATARVHRPTEQRPIDPAAYADDTGLPPETVTDASTPGIAEAAATGEHTIVVNENPTASSALRRATGAPRVVDPVRSVIELNAPEPQLAAERLSALRQKALAAVDEQQRKLADYDANPPLEPTGEVSSVFVDPGAGKLWTKFMESVERDQLAPALGAVEPHDLAALQDAIESIERGVLTDPVTGQGLTPAEGTQLYGELTRLRDATLERAITQRTGRRQAATAARIRPKEPGDFDADLIDRAAAVVDDLGQIVVNDPSLSPLDGFMGTQYVLSKAPTKSRVTGAPLSPRLPFRDYFAGDIIPGLLEEVQSGRVMNLNERTARTRTVALMDAVVGERVERTIRQRAIDNLTGELGRYFDEELRPDEFTKLDKVVRETFKRWRVELEEGKLGGTGLRIYRRMDLLGPQKLNRHFNEAVREVFALGKDDPMPPFVRAMEADGRTVHQLWRRADNRIRQALIKSDLPLSDKLETYYGNFTDAGVVGSLGRWGTVAYQLFRFVGEARWLALEAAEPFFLTGFHGGLRPVIEGATKSAFERAKPVAEFGHVQRELAFRHGNYWAQVADMEQATALRNRMFVREIARRQGAGKTDFRAIVERMAREDPGLARIIGEVGDTPQQFLDRLDRDWRTVEHAGKRFSTKAEASAFFKPWKDAGIIDEAQFREYVDAQKYSYSPAIEAEIARAKTVTDPVAAALYERLGQLNHQLIHDVTATMFGQENRSNLQRALNHPLLYWPISYQIKATKWLLRFMLEESFGVDSGALGGLAIQRVYDEHKRRMQTDEIYREKLTKNNTLYFLASMMLPIAPWDIGVSLSPWSRMVLNPDYNREGGVLGFGWTQTLSFIGRLIQEQTTGDARKRLQQAFPVQISTRARAPSSGGSTSEAAYEAQRIGGQLPLVPFEVPAVPRLP